MFTAFVVLVAAVALALGENLVFLMACLALGLGLASRLRVAANLRRVAVERVAPARAVAGRPAHLRYRVEGPARRTVAGLVLEERLPAGSRPPAHRLEVPVLAGGEILRGTLPVTFTRRGRQALRPIEAWTRFPLGFVEARQTVAEGRTVLVHPGWAQPTAALEDRLSGRSEARARPSLHQRGQDVLHGLREFREGDDPRRIHWRTTARRGITTVSEWRRERGQSLTLVLGRAPGAGPGAAEAFERAVVFAAAAWRLAHRRGLPARLVLGGPGGRRGIAGLVPGLDALAEVRGQGGRRPRAALREAEGGRGPRTLLYVASGPEPGLEERLAAAAGRGGDPFLVRADLPEAARWVRHLPGAAPPRRP
jgi:uncharacterized protein (DUF58 family)